MACPTCDHTMQNLGVNGQKIFWCNRCGTIKTVCGDYEEIEETIWIRNIIYAADLDTRFNQSAQNIVKAIFNCRKYSGNPTKIVMKIDDR